MLAFLADKAAAQGKTADLGRFHYRQLDGSLNIRLERSPSISLGALFLLFGDYELRCDSQCFPALTGAQSFQNLK